MGRGLCHGFMLTLLRGVRFYLDIIYVSNSDHLSADRKEHSGKEGLAKQGRKGFGNHEPQIQPARVFD